VPEPPVPLGPIVEPLGEGLIAVVPDGFAPLLCAAAALPGPLLMPALPTVPEVVPVEEPVVVPGFVVVPVEPVALPVAPPVLVVCAIASVLVSASAAASPNVAVRMNYSLSW
jgi:hypothetical protein